MLEAMSTPRNRRVSVTLLVACSLLAAAAALVGISDNPPGIVLAFVSTLALVLAFVHPWRTVRKYLRLLILAVVGFVAFAILHNVFEGVSGLPGVPGFLRILLQGLHVVAFLLALLVCPPALVVAVVGTVVMAIRNRGRTSTDNGVQA